jgi:hypothetical protein
VDPNSLLQTKPWGTEEFGAIDPNGVWRNVLGVKGDETEDHVAGVKAVQLPMFEKHNRRWS